MANRAAADREQVEVTGRQQLRDWLAEHHETSPGVWVVRWKKAVDADRHVTYEDLVLECLAFGWVDSVPKKVDDDRGAVLCTPRKAGSGWSRPNKERVARLEAEGLMAPAGRAAVERARADGSWSLLDDVEDLVVPDDLAAALEARGARAVWDALGRSPRRGALEQLVQARTEKTRAARVERFADRTAAGERPA